jgi:alkylhydroperoxidase family enzyme
MARVSHIDSSDNPEVTSLINRLAAGRDGRLINIYKMLLHSPPLAEAWFQHNNAARFGTELDDFTREIVILRIAHLNRIPYVIATHVPKHAVPAGLTQEQCEALVNWQPSGLFTDAHRTALALTDAMTLDVQVPDTVVDDVKRHFSERQLVELTVLIGFYNMHNRMVAALDIDPEPEHLGKRA